VTESALKAAVVAEAMLRLWAHPAHPGPNCLPQRSLRADEGLVKPLARAGTASQVWALGLDPSWPVDKLGLVACWRGAMSALTLHSTDSFRT